ncbi:MAG TPA: bifunctional precorrin-2 dehydrogenase/sirohydrochlorin ferrochelatase [Ktedonobacteraceae bacterium]|nr:bifunctional precorrin-2 dehydrogenase/sirohydrochlorin ferrochelatase [Ktedonobacteraceae bacterium]
MPAYYPLMLDLRGRVAIVIGGNRVAAEKAATLAASGALVRVLSPSYCSEMRQLAEQQQVTLEYKTYQPGDLADAFVVVAATNDQQLIETIWTETQERGQLVNIVDVPKYCNFIVPSILRRDQLTIAVSTEGASPGLAKRIRHKLEEHFPPTYGTYIRLASIVRTHLRTSGVSYERRDDFFGDFFDSAILVYVISGNVEQAIATTENILHRYDITLPAFDIAAELQEGKRYVNSNA